MTFAEWWNLVNRRRPYPGKMFSNNGTWRKGRKPLRRRK